MNIPFASVKTAALGTDLRVELVLDRALLVREGRPQGRHFVRARGPARRFIRLSKYNYKIKVKYQNMKYSQN